MPFSAKMGQTFASTQYNKVSPYLKCLLVIHVRIVRCANFELNAFDYECYNSRYNIILNSYNI